MPIDPSVFNNIKSFADYQKADQDFQARKAAAAQTLQSGAIDQASKANVYATQVLSAASATGDQNAYDQAKQTLQGQGIDTSTWAPDVQSGAQQAQAARLAQSPLGTLFNAQQKVIGNNIAGTAAMGSTDAAGAAGFIQPVPSITPSGGVIITPQITNQAPQPAPAPAPPAPAPAPAPAASNAPAPMGNQVKIGTAAGDQAVSDMYDAPPAPQPAPALAKFSAPKQKDGETIQAYKQRVDTALEAYRADPAYIAANAAASETGKAQADAAKAAVGAGANYDQVVQTINGIKALNNSPTGLPQDRGFLPASTQASLAQNLGGTAIGNALGVPPQAVADNENAFTKLNEAQTIGAIKELASTGQIRMTRTLENILNRGYLIEPGSSPTSKNQQSDLILAELNNSKIAAQNVNTGLNGGQATPYQPMPATGGTPAASAPPSGGTLYGTSGGKNVYKMPDGSFLMEQ